jgi:hypothetical protein
MTSAATRITDPMFSQSPMLFWSIGVLRDEFSARP